MDEDSAASVQTAVIERLDYLDKLAINGDHASRAAMATTEIARLTGAWRSLLEQHLPDGHGRCPRCSGWQLWQRRPCRVWRMVHEHLVSETRGRAPSRLSMFARKRFSSQQLAISTPRS
jgi:hypothetical protein